MPASYSLTWSISVINKLNEKYARASYSVYTFLGILPQQHAYFLANHDKMFVKIRELIKLWDSLDKYLGKVDHTKHLYSVIMTTWDKNYRERIQIALDKKARRLTIKGQA